MPPQRIIATVLAFIGAALASFAIVSRSLDPSVQPVLIVIGVVLVVAAIVLYYYRGSGRPTL